MVPNLSIRHKVFKSQVESARAVHSSFLPDCGCSRCKSDTLSGTGGSILEAASQAREIDLPLEWAEARRHLEMLSSVQLAVLFDHAFGCLRLPQVIEQEDYRFAKVVWRFHWLGPMRRHSVNASSRLNYSG